MHTVNRQAFVLHSEEKMFSLVNDIEQYPQFLKWCYGAQLLEKRDDYMVAGLTVSLVGIKQKFTTKNTFIKAFDGHRINLELVNGPFEHLSGHWLFTKLDENASKIELHLEFNFFSGLLNSAFKRAFGTIAQQLVTDFVNRANKVYS